MPDVAGHQPKQEVEALDYAVPESYGILLVRGFRGPARHTGTLVKSVSAGLPWISVAGCGELHDETPKRGTPVAPSVRTGDVVARTEERENRERLAARDSY